MDRRRWLGISGVMGVSSLCRQSHGSERVPSPSPPRLTVEELARRVGEDGFDPESLYAHEIEFRGVVLIKRDVPLLQIRGMTGRFGFDKVHLHGAGGNVDVGSELIVRGLIVDHGYGALMVWQRQWRYADS